jgi:hypothetical protein
MFNAIVLSLRDNPDPLPTPDDKAAWCDVLAQAAVDIGEKYDPPATDLNFHGFQTFQMRGPSACSTSRTPTTSSPTRHGRG